LLRLFARLICADRLGQDTVEKYICFISRLRLVIDIVEHLAAKENKNRAKRQNIGLGLQVIVNVPLSMLVVSISNYFAHKFTTTLKR